MGTLLAALGLNIASQFYKKWFLGTSRIPLPAFIVNTSLVLWLCALFVLPFWSLDVIAALEPMALGKLFLVIVASAIFPWLYYGSMRKVELGRFEALMVLEPLVVITVASLLLPEERDPRIWLAGSVSIGALFWAHASHHHIRFDRYERTLLLLMILTALEAVLIRQLLEIYSPLTFYTLRILFLTPLFVIVFGWQWHHAKGSVGPGIVTSALLSFFSVPLVYLSYQVVGVSVTSLVIGVLAPVSLYFLGERVLHEHTRPRFVIAGLVVLVSVAYLNGWGLS